MDSIKLEKIIRRLMRKRNTPGMAISVTQNNQPIYAKGFGSRDLKKFQEMNADTLIGIGSITKSFTAFAIMKLQEQGMLSIEDSAAKFLPTEPFSSRPGIKIKHMLAHSSGIPSLDAGMLGFTYAFDDFSCVYPATSRDDFLAHLADADEFILYEPGEKFFYNNDMYTCLGFIVEQLAGISFAQFVQQEILDPLEMNRAVFTQAGIDNDPEANAMTGYIFDAKDGKRVAVASEVPIDGHLQAPGGLYVSMNEMLNYAQCLLNDGTFNGQQVLTPESVNTLFTGQIQTPYGAGDNPLYALGWSIEEPSIDTPHRVVHHGGGMSTSQSFMVLVPELNLGISIAENASTGIAPLVARIFIAELLGQDSEEVIEDLRIAKAIDDITGTYKSAYGMYDLTVGMKGGVLQCDLEIDDGSMSFPLNAVDVDKLEFATYSLRSDHKGRVVFQRNAQTGRVEFAAYDRFMYRRV